MDAIRNLKLSFSAAMHLRVPSPKKFNRRIYTLYYTTEAAVLCVYTLKGHQRAWSDVKGLPVLKSRKRMQLSTSVLAGGDVARAAERRVRFLQLPSPNTWDL